MNLICMLSDLWHCFVVNNVTRPYDMAKVNPQVIMINPISLLSLLLSCSVVLIVCWLRWPWLLCCCSFIGLDWWMTSTWRQKLEIKGRIDDWWLMIDLMAMKLMSQSMRNGIFLVRGIGIFNVKSVKWPHTPAEPSWKGHYLQKRKSKRGWGEPKIEGRGGRC